MTTSKYTRFKATRAHLPHLTACAVLSLIRQKHKAVTSHKPASVYNPQIEDTKKRWIESTEKSGLRFVKYADEIIRLGHKGWYNRNDSGNADTYRGAVWQLPARKGCPVYVIGYCDTWSGTESAALIDFDYVLGEKGGTDTTGIDEGLHLAAVQADGRAQFDAEKECEYTMKEDAKTRAAELREEATKKSDALSATILKVNIEIQKLHDEAQGYIDEPWTLRDCF